MHMMVISRKPQHEKSLMYQQQELTHEAFQPYQEKKYIHILTHNTNQVNILEVYSMICRKQLVLTGYRVQYIDIREPKPRTPHEDIHVADSQWLDALSLVGYGGAADNIRQRYERAGYKVIAVEPIKPKRVAELDLCQLWAWAASPAEDETKEAAQ